MYSPAFDRRELLRIGAVSILGGSLLNHVVSADAAPKRHCIFILLQGGPSHHDLWDPKPSAVAEIRGPFQPIDSRVPGMEFGELMERTATVSDRMCVIRSMTHRFSNHIAGTYVTLTGSTNQPDQDREAHVDDFPGPGAVLNYLHPQATSIPRSVSLPTWLSIPGPSNRMPGQYGGFLGGIHDPFLIEGEPQQADYRPLTLNFPDGLNATRVRTRLQLTEQLDAAERLLELDLNRRHDRLRQSAYDLVVDGRVREALQLSKEPDATRDRYGRTRIGQSLLLARRLIEAGVQFVAYNAFNQEWDTHGGLSGRYRQIVPPMDHAFAALIEDLTERGLLERTLVVNTGEFGRTPRVNDNAGRDHWPSVYSTVLAGGGIRGGMVFGESDAQGGEVLSQPVTPTDVLATLWQQLGISPRTEIRDRLNRPMQLTNGRVLAEIL